MGAAHRRLVHSRPCATAAAACLGLWAGAAAAAPPDIDPNAERIEITATRIPEDVETVPGSLTVISGRDLRDRGARDLRSALALAAGLDVAPGGDGGPAGAVPELWGLKEFDAFLLVVDGVPWGGAFVPSLNTLDLIDVDRIEVLRGPAPVMYGATSFVGVIHVIHKAPGSGGGELGAGGGIYGSGLIQGRAPLPSLGRLDSTVSAQVERLGFREDRTQVERGQAAWRGGMPAGGGQLRLTFHGTWIGQEPGSPHPRVGTSLTDQVPVGANHNPDNAHLNERRVQIAALYDRPMPLGSWSGQLSATRSDLGNLRGFLTDVSTASPNANGFRQDVGITDIYADVHAAFTQARAWRAVAGIDHLRGRAFQHGGDFDYTVDLRGDHPPDGNSLDNAGTFRMRDERDFSGLYGQVEWFPADRWRLQAGARLNRTHEVRRVAERELSTGVGSQGDDQRTVTRGSGSAGATWTAWSSGPDAVHLYGIYSTTYKPAVVDFGPEAEQEILEPETAQSYEAGVKGRLAGARVELGASVFRMDFRNLVVSADVGGLPALVNAGEERFLGGELEADWRLREDLRWRTWYSLHDARFGDYLTEFGGVPTQLRGNRLEMSARNMAGTGVIYAPSAGWTGSVQVAYVGNRYLNKRNTALASPYATWSAGFGYRYTAWEVRLDGENLSNERVPASESELGDAQYYLLPARRARVSAVWRF